jgi:hypothetical protein
MEKRGAGFTKISLTQGQAWLILRQPENDATYRLR